MKAYKFLPLILTAFLGGCYVMDIPEAELPNPVVEMTLDDAAFPAQGPLRIDYETSRTISFTYEDISRIVATAPLGWSAVVSMSTGKGTIKVSAPKYDAESVQSGDVLLKIYDGSGAFTEQTFSVYAVEAPVEFEILDFDPSKVFEFSLGSRSTLNYTFSTSFKMLDCSLPKGWQIIEKGRGTFILVAPDLTVVDGEASGTVTITPVSWTGVKGQPVSFEVFVDASKPSFEFIENRITFKPGETKDVEVLAKGLRDLKTPPVPAGWTIDYSKILDGTITVTAPSGGTEPFEGISTMELTAVSNIDNTPISASTIIRLYGINSGEDLLAFRAVYEADNANEPHTEPELIGEWLVDGALKLNKDITLTSDALTARAYVIKYLNIPLNGDGHTITLDLNCNAAVAGLFQYNNADIRNLKLAGQLTNSYPGASYIASLVVTPRTATFENVESAVNIHYAVSGRYSSRLGGLCALSASGYAPTFKNCKYTGVMTLDNDAASIGGILGSTDTGKPGAMTVADGCSFDGQIILNHQTADGGVNVRMGGIIGDIARQGTVSNCTSTGTFTINAGGKRLIASNAMGVGGLVGRITAPASGYTMSAIIKNVTFTGTIKLNNLASNEDKTRYGQILGCIPNDNAAGILVRENWTEGGTIAF